MPKSLKDFLTKKYEKTGAVNILTEIEFLDTGIPSLNYVLSGRPLTGGIPLSGKMTMMYGPEGAGKTSLVNQIISQAQKKDFDVVYIDTERSITQPRLKQFGIDIDKMTYATPEYIEEVFDVIESVCIYRLAEKDDIRTLVIWDSIAGTPAKMTLERDADDNEMAADARALTRGLKRVRGKIKNSNVGVLFVNQARANLERFGDLFSLPGGFALKHMVDLVVRVNKSKDKTRTDGQIIKFSTPDKNRMFRPFQSTDVFFDFDRCFTRENLIESYVEFLINVGIFVKAGISYAPVYDVMELAKTKNIEFDEALEEVKKRRKADWYKFLQDDNEWTKLLKDTEDYIQKNIRDIAEKGKDDESVMIAEAAAKKAKEDYKGQEEEIREILNEDDNEEK